MKLITIMKSQELPGILCEKMPKSWRNSNPPPTHPRTWANKFTLGPSNDTLELGKSTESLQIFSFWTVLYYSYQYSMYVASIVRKLNFNFRGSGWICKCASRYQPLQNHQKLSAAAASQPLGMPDLLAPSCLVKTWMSPLSIFSWIASWGMWRSEANSFPSDEAQWKKRSRTRLM